MVVTRDFALNRWRQPDWLRYWAVPMRPHVFPIGARSTCVLHFPAFPVRLAQVLRNLRIIGFHLVSIPVEAALKAISDVAEENCLCQRARVIEFTSRRDLASFASINPFLAESGRFLEHRSGR